MEKKFGRFFSMFFMLLMAGCMVCLTSCKDDDEDGDANHDSRLIGTWECYYGRDTETFTFNADGNGIYEYKEDKAYGSYTDKATFTWQTKDNKTIYGTVTFKDEDEYQSETYTEKYSVEYSISGNKLTIIGSISDTDTDATQTFTKKK